METENEGQLGSALMLNAYEKIVEQLNKTMPTAVEQVKIGLLEFSRGSSEKLGVGRSRDGPTLDNRF